MSTADNASEGFRLHTGNVAQTGLHYLSAGKGEPVVLLHGWGGFKEMCWGTMQALSPSHSIIAFDWPGHGSSGPLEAGLPVLDALADLALASFAVLGLRGVTLVGHSLGGNVAVRVALARPDLVARLVLIDAVVDPGHLPATSWLLAQPTLVLVGERDPLIRPHQARDLARQIPHAQLCLVKRAYHCPMDEQPAAFNRALIDFLSASL